MYEVELRSDRRLDPCLRNYLQTIGKYKLLTREEEFELARRIRGGDREALDQLVNANLRFVVSVAKRFFNHGLSCMDLIAEGNIGLITAARRFDERREFRFITYAIWWVRQTIQKAIADQTSTVRLPINRVHQARKIKRMAQTLEQRRGRAVNDEEIAAALDLSPRKANEIRAASRPPLSIDEGVYDGTSPLADMLEDGASPNPEEGHFESELQEEIAGALRLLSQRERNIVVRYYGLGDVERASLDAIGREINLSRERVRQVRNQALRKLRQTGNRKKLMDLLY